MPQQAQASEESIKAFSALDSDKQRTALGRMSPEAKTALLAGIKSRRSAKPATTSSKLPAPPPTSEEGTLTKLGRGAVLGAAHGAGIPESADWTEVVGGAIKNAATGLYETAKSSLTDPNPMGLKDIPGAPPSPPSALHNMASNIEGSGGEAWAGVKEKDPEKFAHGLASMVTQVLMLRTPGKAKVGEINPRARLAKTAVAINAGAEEAGQLRTAMPEIVKQAQNGGISTVGEFKDAVQQASRTIDQEFNQHLAPIGNRPYIPAEIARRIRNLITEDMKRTAEGRAQIKEINRRAKEYEKPWRIKELNAKRMTENDNLNSFYKKDSQAQAASKLDTDISKAVRDGAADVVYDQMARNNPHLPADYWSNLKQKQGAMWGLRDHLTAQMKNLDAAQLQHEGKGVAGRMRVHAYASPQSVPHGYVSGVGEALSAGPEKVANRGIKSAFNPTLGAKARRLGAAALPIAHLANPPEPVRKTPFPPPPSTSEDDEDQ